MTALFGESFEKDLSALTEVGILRRIRKMIEQVEAAAKAKGKWTNK